MVVANRNVRTLTMVSDVIVLVVMKISMAVVKVEWCNIKFVIGIL